MRSPVRVLEQRVGGRERLIVIASLAAVLALDSADKGAISATAQNLQDAFSIGKTDIGLLITVSSLLGAAATIPFGVLADRVARTRVLFIVIVMWSGAMLGGALAPTYGWLLVSRLFLGLMTAAAYPSILSLVGDWFPIAERGRVLGFVLAGELVGTGLGIATAGVTAAALSWRAAFGVLAVPALGVAWLVQRLDEPERGGAGLPGASDAAGTTGGDARSGSVRALVVRAGVEPDGAAVLHGDGEHLGLGSVLRYVLRIRTNVILVISSSLGYYMFAGIRAFGVEFASEHYGVSQGVASLLVFVVGAGAVVGVVAGGHLSDHLLARGVLDARIVVPAVAFLGMAVLFAPAVVTTSLVVALPLLSAAAFLLAIANPSLDAARLDVVPPALWGRAEAVRTVLKTGLEAIAPLLFGVIAEHVFGGESGRGLEQTFLVMLIPLFASPIVLAFARRSYLTDVATAAASARAEAHENANSAQPGSEHRPR